MVGVLSSAISYGGKAEDQGHTNVTESLRFFSLLPRGRIKAVRCAYEGGYSLLGRALRLAVKVTTSSVVGFVKVILHEKRLKIDAPGLLIMMPIKLAYAGCLSLLKRVSFVERCDLVGWRKKALGWRDGRYTIP